MEGLGSNKSRTWQDSRTVTSHRVVCESPLPSQAHWTIRRPRQERSATWASFYQQFRYSLRPDPGNSRPVTSWHCRYNVLSPLSVVDIFPRSHPSNAQCYQAQLARQTSLVFSPLASDPGYPASLERQPSPGVGQRPHRRANFSSSRCALAS